MILDDVPPPQRAAAEYVRRKATGGRPALQDDSAAERAAELRHAERTRCVHRGATPLRHEGCACAAMSLIPIYRCELLDAECSDLRTPAAPALDCRRCPSRKPG